MRDAVHGDVGDVLDPEYVEFERSGGDAAHSLCALHQHAIELQSAVEVLHAHVRDVADTVDDLHPADLDARRQSVRTLRVLERQIRGCRRSVAMWRRMTRFDWSAEVGGEIRGIARTLRDHALPEVARDLRQLVSSASAVLRPPVRLTTFPHSLQVLERGWRTRPDAWRILTIEIQKIDVGACGLQAFALGPLQEVLDATAYAQPTPLLLGQWVDLAFPTAGAAVGFRLQAR